MLPARTTPLTPIVTLSDAAKVYANGTVALRGLDLRIEEREFVSLLGPSGCGKSTVLRLIAGLGALTGGRLDWPGREAGAVRRRLGFVFQEPTLMPWADVFDNVWTPLRIAGQSRHAAAERVRHAIGTVGLDGFEHAYPRELSGGMKMRVSIARALVTEPELLLLDEPFAALDEITRFKLNTDLLELWRTRALTVVFVTHSVFESVFLSSRILVMTPRPGRVAEQIRIEGGYPRDESFRTSAAYGEQCRMVSRCLAAAMAG